MKKSEWLQLALFVILILGGALLLEAVGRYSMRHFTLDIVGAQIGYYFLFGLIIALPHALEHKKLRIHWPFLIASVVLIFLTLPSWLISWNPFSWLYQLLLNIKGNFLDHFLYLSGLLAGFLLIKGLFKPAVEAKENKNCLDKTYINEQGKDSSAL